MSNTTSLAMQRQCVEHLLAFAESRAGDMSASVIEGCRQAVLSLAWIERRQDLIKALDRMERHRPDLAEIFKEFPNAEIVDVRDMYFNGSGSDD